MPAFENFHVAAVQEGLALSAALRQFQPGLPWSKVRRLIHNRHVQVNGNLCADEARKLKAGDVIRLWAEPQARPPGEEDLRIRYLDSHLVVVEKPAGVTTVRHAAERDWPQHRRQFQPTLDELLQKVLARKTRRKTAAKSPRTSGKRPRLPMVRAVHRLDRDTSGLMVFARSVEAERGLVQMFRKHQVHRVYLAVVQGELGEQTFESYFVRDRGDGRRGSTRLPEVGKRAVTRVRPLERLGGYTLVECRLETGRTHQIRIHLAEAGHMVCGEKVYHRPLFGEPVADQSGALRQALHAAELGFRHPVSGEPLEFKMPMPDDMVQLIARLRKTASG